MTSIPLLLLDLLKRSKQNKQPFLLVFIGLSCVLIYAFSRTGFPDVARVTSTLAGILGLWGIYKYGASVNSHILFRFVWASIAIQIIAWALSLYSHFEWALDIPQIDYLSRYLIFIPLAWWLSQYKNTLWLLYGAGSLGIFVSLWTSGYGIPEIIDGIHGTRIDLGLQNAQHTSLLFGVVTIGLCCFIKPIAKKNIYSIIPMLFLIAYCLLIIYSSASRQSWLALFITAFLAASYATYTYLKKANRKKKALALSCFIAGVLLSVSLLASNNTIVNRVMQEKEALSSIFALDLKNVPYSSFGVRFHSWVAAVDFIKEKPLLGWGSNGQTLVIKHTPWLPEHVRQDFGHLHNTYLEILVNFGTIGLIFYLSFWVYFSKLLYKKVKKGEIEKEIGYFYAAFLCFWSIMNCFESYQNYWTGVFCLHIVMAGILSKIWYLDLHRTETPH